MIAYLSRAYTGFDLWGGVLEYVEISSQSPMFFSLVLLSSGKKKFQGL